MMMEEIREGHYKDKYGRWQKDRRCSLDRRDQNGALTQEHERRKMFRRKADREILDKDHRDMIEDALTDFAQEHGGHL